MLRFAPLLGSIVAVLSLAGATFAGVTNPNIWIIGQPSLRWTDDETDPAAKRAVFDLGEAEVVFDDYLNPYAKGFFTLSFGADEAGIEEGFFTLLRGMPAGLQLKGGKYRVPFGKINPVHHGQHHITYSRPANSVAIAELSPAFLHITARRDPSRAFSIGG